MSAIDDKHNALKANGLDLGAALSAEEDAGYGGRVRAYEHGNIYWHPSTGAHEVHGGILTLYLAHGGPGVDPGTGIRELGFPTTDEIASPWGPPMSWFETGGIYWIPGTRGCVVFGALFEYLKNQALGMPLTGNTPVAGGTAVYCERGVLFEAPAAVPAGHRFVVGTIDPPLMGRPMILDPDDDTQRRYAFSALWQTFDRKTYEALTAWRPSVFADLWGGRLALSPVGSPFSLLQLGVPQVRIVDETVGQIELEASFEIPVSPLLKDRTLYDLQLNLPVGIPYPLSPHCLYSKRSWDDFGLFHITDLHVNRRNDLFRQQLQDDGLTDAAQHYSNFQDSLRDFIKYANKLHDLGLADAVMATGDLIDYLAEDEDGSTTNNFVRLRQLILGQPFDGRDPAGEELRLPVFTTFGNHDYRLHPYDLTFSIDPPLIASTVVSNYSSHNLIESDAIALEGGKRPSYGVSDLDKAFRMIQYGLDPEQPGGAYWYYEKYFVYSRSYAVALGKHRLVMLDSGPDDGVPGSIDTIAFLIDYLADSPSLGLAIPESTKTLMGGGTPSVGLSDAEVGLVRQALTDAAAGGVVIVGLHAPPFEPAGHEYGYFFRETLHPTADARLVDAFVKRRKLDGATWPRTGTPYFKTGDTSDGLDADAIVNNRDQLISVCAGVGQPRAVDLVLFGHVHDRVEFRIRWNAAEGHMEYYTDFYTENPGAYYHTPNVLPPLPDGAPVHVRVVPGAPTNAPIQRITYHPSPGSGAQPLVYGQIATPPYALPLDSVPIAQAPAWWEGHRPLFVQTSALGPMDPRQRFGTFWEIDGPLGIKLVEESEKQPAAPHGLTLHGLPAVVPDPPAQGFRLIQVADDTIWRIRYVLLGELRRNGFTMPWEDERPHPRPFHVPVVHPHPVAEA